MGTKRCNKCGIEKPLNEFYSRVIAKDGHRGTCKICENNWQKEKRKNDPDSMHKYDRQYREAHKKSLSIALKRSYSNHRDARISYANQYRSLYSDRAKESVNRYRKANPEKIKANNHKRNAMIEGTGGKYTANQWKTILDFYSPGRICLRCGASKKLSVDHVFPIKLGGLNVASNLQPLCINCNSKKGIKEIDYRPDGGAYAKWVEENLK